METFLKFFEKNHKFKILLHQFCKNRQPLDYVVIEGSCRGCDNEH